jgi:hypothetical protein
MVIFFYHQASSQYYFLFVRQRVASTLLFGRSSFPQALRVHAKAGTKHFGQNNNLCFFPDAIDLFVPAFQGSWLCPPNEVRLNDVKVSVDIWVKACYRPY